MTQTVERVSRPRLTLVIPCRNEEQVLPETAIRLVTLLEELTQEALISEPSIFFVDDGSTDGTWSVIERLAGRCADHNRRRPPG
jgi:glycosyltransferase involved in cell wall biosynthesis